MKRKISDFTKGQEAFILNEDGRYRMDHATAIRPTAVTVVGRKYVTVETGARFEEWRGDCLLEKNTVGWRRLLFLTEEDALDYLKREDLRTWIRQNASRAVEGLGTEQLEKIKEIMEEAAGERPRE